MLKFLISYEKNETKHFYKKSDTTKVNFKVLRYDESSITISKPAASTGHKRLNWSPKHAFLV